MKARIGWTKLLLLAAMSAFGTWASSMVIIVYYMLQESLPFCPLQEGPGIVMNCDAVLESRYSMVFGVPLELFAVAYFVINLLLVYFIAFGNDRLFKASLKTLFGWRFLGIAIVPYLVFVELFLVKAICIYCTMMHVAIIADFLIITYLLFFKRRALIEPTSHNE